MASYQRISRLSFYFIIFLCVVLIGQLYRLPEIFRRLRIPRAAKTLPTTSQHNLSVELKPSKINTIYTLLHGIDGNQKLPKSVDNADLAGNIGSEHSLHFIYPNYTSNFSMYGDGSCRTNKDRNIIAKLFEKWIEIAKRENIEYFLTCGSLLGSYRNGNLIPYDSDMDVLINREDFAKINKYHSKKKFIGTERDIFVFINRDFYLSYKKRRRFSCKGKEVPAYMDHCSFQEPLGRIITENRHLDIYDYTKNGTQLWDPSEGGRTYNEHEVFPLRKCFLMGYETKCPNKPREFLAKHYGSNLSPNILCKNGVWVKKIS